MHRPHGALLDLVRVEAPAGPLLQRETVKLHLRIDHDDDDDLLDALIDTVEAQLDGYAGTLGRALAEQSWKLSLPAFPGHSGYQWSVRRHHARHHLHIRLPLPPLISVTEVAYVDPEGVDQVLDPSQYVVLDGPLATIQPAPGVCWPSTAHQARAASITYVAGYGAPEAVPAPILAAARLMLADLYDNRAAIQIDASRATLIESPTTDRLLRPFRIPRT
jgi:uncharacterized phiE125 gp8 family phage protein